MTAFLVAAALLWAGPAAADCVPEFPYTRWLGADAAYSIPLPDGRSFWLFGDTFIAARGKTTRKGARMVANTVGLSTCEKGRFRISYSWRGSSTAAAAYFQPTDAGFKYWPLDGFVHAGKIYVALSRIRDVKEGLGFANVGTDLASISVGTGTPTAWKVEVAALSKDTSAYVGSSIVVENGYAYLFSAIEGGEHPAALARLPLRFVRSPAEHLEYLAQDGSWKPGLDLADAKRVID
ncbi:MAG: hypothetical protein NTX64_19050, partial [Elusimicrobia bacterium]|nr:hypothetical protein [Elusimicrobiota bacterium]